MKRIFTSCALLGALANTLAAFDEPVAHAPITGLALYKNGVVSITRKVTPPPEWPFLITGKFDPAHGSLWIDSDEPVSIKSIPDNPNAMRVEGPLKPFTITYLTKGVAWAPAYRINLLDDKKLRLTLSTVLRNEFMPFRDAEVQLITGFPNLEFSERPSLINPGMTLASFFQQLGGGLPAPAAPSVMVQSRAPSPPGAGLPADINPNFTPPALDGEGANDIHFHDIGRVTMEKNQSLYFQLDQMETVYQRFVDWNIPARRDDNGRLTNSETRELWDAIRFTNPFNMPLTTAPPRPLKTRKSSASPRFIGQTPGSPSPTASPNPSVSLEASGKARWTRNGLSPILEAGVTAIPTSKGSFA